MCAYGCVFSVCVCVRTGIHIHCSVSMILNRKQQGSVCLTLCKKVTECCVCVYGRTHVCVRDVCVVCFPVTEPVPLQTEWVINRVDA